MYFVLIIVPLFDIVTSFIFTIENNKSIKQQVEDAGCPYHKDTQLLRESICLMPNYKQFDPPEKNQK